MAMTIMHDGSTALTLGELNKNTNKLSEDLQKISSGQKINFAKDDTAQFCISEKMRSLIRSLQQDIENSQTGANLVRTAEDGIQGIINSLSTMRELAIDSLNDHNSDEDRKILQKEFASRMSNIDCIAYETTYNGIVLLDGRWRQISGEGETVMRTRTETVIEYETVSEEYKETVTTYEEVEEEYEETVTTYEEVEEEYEETVTTYEEVEEEYEETVTTYEEVEEEYEETVTTYEEVEEEYPYTYTKKTEKPLESHAVRPSPAVPTGVIEPNKAMMIIIPDTYTGDYHIKWNGTYRIPENYTGTLYIEAQNVSLIQANPSKPLNDVYIETQTTGNTNLWLNDLNLRYRNLTVGGIFEKSFIKFQGSNNVLTLNGNNKINPLVGISAAIYEKAFVNVGDGLTIEGSGTLEFHEDMPTTGHMSGAFIGSDHNELSSANITINSGNIITSSSQTTPYGRTTGAVIGSGDGGSIGDIKINGGTLNLNINGVGACIGGGMDSTTGNITIQDATIKASCDDGACIGSGSVDEGTSRTGYIYILNSDLNLNNVEMGGHSDWENPSGTGAAIGGGGTYNGLKTYVGDITIENSIVKTVTDRGAGIGTGGDSEVGGTGEPHAYGISIIDSTLNTKVNDSRAEKIGKGVHGIIPVEYDEEEITEMRTRTVTVPRESTVTKTRTVTVPRESTVTKTQTVTIPHESTVTKTRTVTVPRESTVTKTRTVTIPHESTVTKTRTVTVPHESTKTIEYQEKTDFAKNPLIIHTGPKANEELRLHINDMRTKAMGLEDVTVDPLEKAREALEKLDWAVDYALNENVRMGAYQSRLQATIDNLITENENAINSESIIRDADMAKEMTSYTKNNILSQAAQAILAQANQNMSSVLSLLQ